MSVAISPVQTVREAFNFEVEKFPLFGPDGMKTNRYGMFRSDTSGFVGEPCAKKYEPHQTDQVILLVEAAEKVFDENVDVKCNFNDGHQVVIAPGNDYRQAIYGTEDNIFPRVMISARYDGHAVKAQMGFFRDLCRNLSRMKMIKGTSVSIRHSSLLPSRMNDLITTFEKLKDSWKNLTEIVAKLETIPVNLDAFLLGVYGAPKESKRGGTMHEKRHSAIIARVARERDRSGRLPMVSEVSAWEAYNAVQGYSQWDQNRHKNMSETQRIWQSANDLGVLAAERYVMSLIA